MGGGQKLEDEVGERNGEADGLPPLQPPLVLGYTILADTVRNPGQAARECQCMRAPHLLPQLVLVEDDLRSRHVLE